MVIPTSCQCRRVVVSYFEWSRTSGDTGRGKGPGRHGHHDHGIQLMSMERCRQRTAVCASCLRAWGEAHLDAECCGNL